MGPIGRLTAIAVQEDDSSLAAPTRAGASTEAAVRNVRRGESVGKLGEDRGTESKQEQGNTHCTGLSQADERFCNPEEVWGSY